VTDRDLVDGYLGRLGFEDRPAPTADRLDALQLAHLRRVPFENLDLHIGRPVVIDVDRFVRKVVVEGRGGFCYELNGAFAWLLTSLGYEVELLEARVHGPGGPTRPFDHLCLRVGGPGGWLVDVGFGDSFDRPLPLRFDEVHRDANGAFQLVDVGDGWVDLVRDGVPTFRFDRAPRAIEDFAPGCAFHQTPASHFLRNTICSLRTEDGRVTVSGLLLVTTVDGVRTEEPIDPPALGPLLADRFGVHLEHDEIERLVAASPG
jgi:N-hydroxyarylamine O-acetyltransferase